MGVVHVLNGRLTRALERLRGWRHFPPDDSAELVAVAAALEERGDPYTRDELKLLALGERLALMTRSQPRPPTPPSPFDKLIVEAEDTLTLEDGRMRQSRRELEDARDARSAAVDRVRDAKGQQDSDTAYAALDAAHERFVRAEADYLIADHTWLRAKSRVMALCAARSRWLQERASTVRGPGGKIMTLAEYGALQR